MKHSVSPTSLYLVRYIFWKKMTVHEMIDFLFIRTRHEAFGIFNIFPLPAITVCLVRYICLEKDDFVINISSWDMPQLEIFLIKWYVMCSYMLNVKHSVSVTFCAI